MKKKWVILSAVVLAAALVAYGLLRPHGPHISYQPLKIARGSIRATILSTGTVAPENRLDLKPPVAGRIEKILVEEGQHVKAGQVLAWMSSSERAALIDTAKSKSKQELDYWEGAYKMTPILSPGNGVVILKSADEGQTVVTTDAVMSLSDRLIVKANVDETDLSQVKLNQKTTLVLDAFRNETLDAKVVHIGYDSKTVNNVTTYEVDVLALHTPAYMKSGMTANVTFVLSEKENVLLIPASAIQREDTRNYVFVPNPQSPRAPLTKDIVLGMNDGKKAEVVSGLEEGDTVLVKTVKTERSANNGGPLSPFGPKPPQPHR